MAPESAIQTKKNQTPSQLRSWQKKWSTATTHFVRTVTTAHNFSAKARPTNRRSVSAVANVNKQRKLRILPIRARLAAQLKWAIKGTNSAQCTHWNEVNVNKFFNYSTMQNVECACCTS